MFHPTADNHHRKPVVIVCDSDVGSLSNETTSSCRGTSYSGNAWPLLCPAIAGLTLRYSAYGHTILEKIASRHTSLTLPRAGAAVSPLTPSLPIL